MENKVRLFCYKFSHYALRPAAGPWRFNQQRVPPMAHPRAELALPR
jgi:hypothetical protein